MYELQRILRRQVAASWRFRWLAVLVCWLVCAGGWYAVLMAPKVYESSARMYVDADAILTPLLRGLTVDPSLQAQVDLLSRTLLSRPNLEKLISKTDLDLQVNSETERQALTEKLATEIKITPQTRNLFIISYRNESPKLAHDVVQSMLTAFVEGKAGNNRTDLENAARFLDSQISLYERQLREAERRRTEFRAKYMDLLPNDFGISKLEAAQNALRGLQGQLEDAQLRRAALAKELAGTPPVLVTERQGGGGGAPSRLFEAEQRLRELQLRLTDAHPDVIAQRELIAALRSGKLGQGSGESGRGAAGPSSTAVANPMYEQLKVRLVETETGISSLMRQISEARKETDRLETIAKSAPGVQAEYLNLNRDYEILSRNYNDLLARRESMRLSAAAEANADKVKIQIIDPPFMPLRPVPGRQTILLTAVLIVGLGAGIGTAVLLAQFDQSFRTTEDLNDLGYPVVGGVSLLGAAVPIWNRAVAVGGFGAAILLPCLVYGGLLMRVLSNSGSA